uniref:Uncharacterized protein n=1 Tax=Mastacembelus armatus TaxID=205130 RepID=A0A3Q3N3H1_9TELE
MDGRVCVYSTYYVVVCPCLTLYLCNLCNEQIKYKESVGQGTAIPDPPDVKRVKETQKNISLVEDQTCMHQTPHTYYVVVCPCLTLYLCNLCNEQIKYKESVGQGTAIPDPPDVKRVKETQKNISLVEDQTCCDPYLSP